MRFFFEMAWEGTRMSPPPKTRQTGRKPPRLAVVLFRSCPQRYLVRSFWPPRQGGFHGQVPIGESTFFAKPVFTRGPQLPSSLSSIPSSRLLGASVVQTAPSELVERLTEGLTLRPDVICARPFPVHHTVVE